MQMFPYETRKAGDELGVLMLLLLLKVLLITCNCGTTATCITHTVVYNTTTSASRITHVFTIKTFIILMPPLQLPLCLP